MRKSELFITMEISEDYDCFNYLEDEDTGLILNEEDKKDISTDCVKGMI